MLPEAGATELIFIAVVALIVVGPKDLPALLRKVGQFTAKMRGLAAEFRASFDELARQSELDELRREVDALRTGQYMQPITKELDHHRQEIDQHFDDLHKEFGAPPPLLTDGTILPGPDATPALPAPAPDAAPVASVAEVETPAWPQLSLPLSAPPGEVHAEPTHTESSHAESSHADPARETAG